MRKSYQIFVYAIAILTVASILRAYDVYREHRKPDKYQAQSEWNICDEF